MSEDKFRTKVAFKKELKEKKTRKLDEWAPFFIIKSFDDRDTICYIPLDKEMVIGRKEDADVYINDEQASRAHAKVKFSDGRVTLWDLKSTNGTIINGVKAEEKVLEDGDEIIIGSSILEFYIPMSIGDKISGISVKTHNYFEMRLEEELDRTARYERALSLMMISVDSPKVKLVEKDKILAELVIMINGLIRTMDLLASYGQTELELLLPETNKDEAYKLAQRITSEAKKNFDFPLSVGIASYPHDSFTKDMLIDRSRKALKIARQKDDDKISYLSENVKKINLSDHEIIIQSDKMSQVFEMVARIANSNISVLVQGETGVGKEVIAEAVHYQSPRKNHPLISVNCAALTETLLESELFGHEKGSFTGAERTKIGLFETSKGGTIFLDEIGEMPIKTQVKLLRVLQSRKILRVGSSQEIDVDIRVIAASNKNLEDLVEKGSFREDLYYRLNAITVTVPPLRERKEEIPYLVMSFIKQFNIENGRNVTVVSPDAMDLLCQYEWPGNIRELKNCIERAVVISEGDSIYKEHLGAKVFKQPPLKGIDEDDEALAGEERETFVGDMKEIINSYEKKIIIGALKKANWNQTKASLILKIPRRTLVSKIKKYSISRG